MPHRQVLLFCCLVVFAAACSRGPERARMSPTAPSGLGGTGLAGAQGALSGPLDAFFPPRNEAFDFRQQLDAKYQNQLRRSPTLTFVDSEGDVVWTQEYIRYRVNGCDHATAVQRVFAQIDGNAPGAICGISPDGLVAFPPRNEALDFRRALETKYQDMRRGLSQTFVDLEGSVIWTQEYIRYRTNACDHAASVKNVFDQIDGGPIAAVCYVPPPCLYTLSESPQNVSGNGGSFSVIAYRRAGDCTWTATSESSFLKVNTPQGGSAGVLEYTVDKNPGTARTGTIRLDWTGGSTQLVVNQGGPSFLVSFELIDPSRSTDPTTECQIRLPSTTCRLTATANLPEAIATYHWDVTYFYGSQIFKVQANSSPTFNFLEACGGPASTTEGNGAQLSVTLKVTDTAGNTATVNSGSGGQPGLAIVFFKCP